MIYFNLIGKFKQNITFNNIFSNGKIGPVKLKNKE